jgi:hypothetical protein
VVRGASGTHLETATTWLRFFTPNEPSDPVFVDSSGRRKLLWRVVGVLVALVCVTFVGLLLFAAISGSPTAGVTDSPSVDSLPATSSSASSASSSATALALGR